MPASDGAQPFPAWKRIDALQDSLRPQDQGKAALEGGVISQDEYGAKASWRANHEGMLRAFEHRVKEA